MNNTNLFLFFLIFLIIILLLVKFKKCVSENFKSEEQSDIITRFELENKYVLHLKKINLVLNDPNIIQTIQNKMANSAYKFNIKNIPNDKDSEYFIKYINLYICILYRLYYIKFKLISFLCKNYDEIPENINKEIKKYLIIDDDIGIGINIGINIQTFILEKNINTNNRLIQRGDMFYNWIDKMVKQNFEDYTILDTYKKTYKILNDFSMDTYETNIIDFDKSTSPIKNPLGIEKKKMDENIKTEIL